MFAIAVRSRESRRACRRKPRATSKGVPPRNERERRASATTDAEIDGAGDHDLERRRCTAGRRYATNYSRISMAWRARVLVSSGPVTPVDHAPLVARGRSARAMVCHLAVSRRCDRGVCLVLVAGWFTHVKGVLASRAARRYTRQGPIAEITSLVNLASIPARPRTGAPWNTSSDSTVRHDSAWPGSMRTRR